MCRRWTDKGCGQNTVAVWPAPFRVTNRLCHHCHPADGTFDSRDTLVDAISPNVLTEVSKEVEKSEIALQYRTSIIDYIIHLSLAKCCALVDWVTTMKFKTTKINSGGFV